MVNFTVRTIILLFVASICSATISIVLVNILSVERTYSVEVLPIIFVLYLLLIPPYLREKKSTRYKGFIKRFDRWLNAKTSKPNNENKGQSKR